jgi:hypothetical protein
LIRVQLLGTTAELVALQYLNDRSQALDLGLKDFECIELTGLFEDERT